MRNGGFSKFLEKMAMFLITANNLGGLNTTKKKIRIA